MKARISVAVMFALFAAITSGGCGSSDSSPQSESQRMLQAMTLREKVGQMFIIRPEHLCPNLSAEEIHYNLQSFDVELNDDMRASLKDYPAGGFAIFSRNIKSPEQLRKLIADLKEASSTVPFIAVDEEGGRVARLGNHSSFDVPKPEPMQTIGDTGEPGQAFDAGSTIGKYIKEYGFNLDFAPVADVNTNPDNIVIGDRAFGSDPQLVSEMVSAFLDGLHSEGILGTIKHFPGHGDTTSDTHSGYVAVFKTWDELLEAELIPFIDNFEKTDLVMTAHITMRNVTSDDLPATISRELLTGRLREELGYDGVIITDSMEMAAINESYPSGEAAVRVVEAGGDIILLPYDYRASFNAVLEAVNSGRLTEERINESVSRILALKFKEGE